MSNKISILKDKLLRGVITLKLNGSSAMKRQRGATMVEYGILVAAIAVVSIVVLFTLGGVIEDGFQSVVTAIQEGGGGEAGED